MLTSNDVVILTLTPVIYHFSKATGIDPAPLLFLEFFTANVWSMALLIGRCRSETSALLVLSGHNHVYDNLTWSAESAAWVQAFKAVSAACRSCRQGCTPACDNFLMWCVDRLCLALLPTIVCPAPQATPPTSSSARPSTCPSSTSPSGRCCPPSVRPSSPSEAATSGSACCTCCAAPRCCVHGPAYHGASPTLTLPCTRHACC